MEKRKRYSEAEQEMVISLYEESGKTMSEFSEAEGLDARKLERWMRTRKSRVAEAVRMVEVEERPEETKAPGRVAGKYRLGFGNGAWLEMEGSFEAEAVRVLTRIMREEAGC
ncbi:hypothetical protein BH09VER1_BH09VER1_53780 [soil metagenome]